MRHAESVNNMRQRKAAIPGVFTRVPDPPLTPRGREQAEAAARRVGPLLAPHPAAVEIYTSDMTRAIETALHLARGLRREIPGMRVCVVPLPFFNEMGSDTVVQEPDQSRFAATARECGAVLDTSLWRSSWKESREVAGEYEACLPLFLGRVLPWLRRRCAESGRVPLLIGHGQYMRTMLGVWRRFGNTDLLRCRFSGSRVGLVEIVR